MKKILLGILIAIIIIGGGYLAYSFIIPALEIPEVVMELLYVDGSFSFYYPSELIPFDRLVAADPTDAIGASLLANNLSLVEFSNQQGLEAFTYQARVYNSSIDELFTETENSPGVSSVDRLEVNGLIGVLSTRDFEGTTSQASFLVDDKLYIIRSPDKELVKGIANTVSYNTEVLPETSSDNMGSEEVIHIGPTEFRSNLYPVVQFNLVDGWIAKEPKDYDTERPWPADANILLTKDGFELILPFATSIPTGFEGGYCDRDDSLKILTETETDFGNAESLSRYADGDSYVYGSVVLENSSTFKELFTNNDWAFEIRDSESNYCTDGSSPLFIIGINSIVGLDGGSGVEQDQDGDGLIDAWLMRPRTNTTNVDGKVLSEADRMVSELFNNVAR